MHKVIIGQILLVICCIFYVIWWSLCYKPDVIVNRTGGINGILLLITAGCGLAGTALTLYGLNAMPLKQTPKLNGAIILLGGIIVMMLIMNWKLALVAFAVVPIIAVITVLCRNALRRNFIKMKALTGQINGFIAESLSGIRVIQAFNREKEKYEELDVLNKE